MQKAKERCEQKRNESKRAQKETKEVEKFPFEGETKNGRAHKTMWTATRTIKVVKGMNGVRERENIARECKECVIEFKLSNEFKTHTQPSRMG